MTTGLALAAVALVLALALIGPARADTSWTGGWDTRWRDGGARLELVQDGTRVTGHYPLYDGRIEATARGRRLDGRWTEGSRSGTFVFVLSRDGSTFAGRYDTGEWWTGARAAAAGPAMAIDLGSPREALRTFTVASNLARAGRTDAQGTAAEALDHGPDAGSLSHGEKLARAVALFDLVDLTTFRIWSVPAEAVGDAVTVRLEQPGGTASLPLTLVRDESGTWRIRVPTPEAMAELRRALLAQTGGQPPAAEAFRRLRSPRDTMRAFLTGTSDWDGNGRALALSALDLSAIPEALRDAQGNLAAQYLRRAIDQIGLAGLQAIPNRTPNRDTYVHFVHPAGRIAIAPTGDAAEAPWKFTAQTVAEVNRILIAIEDLPPPAEAVLGSMPAHGFFAWRNAIRDHAPALLGTVGETEYWQILGAVLLLIGTAIPGLLAALVLPAGLRWLVGPDAVQRPRLLAWSAGITVAFVVAARAAPSLGAPESIREYTYPTAGTLCTIAAATLGWLLLGIAGLVVARRAERTDSPTDDILLTLVLAAARLGIVIGASLGVAYFLSIPTSGILAGLGIGGLAFAFASKETLSNVFGAGILVADRPFRRGDWINAGDVAGAVEHVGIRSTRLRTAQDSVVVVPNGKLADSIIDNLGTRRHRLVRASLLVTANATPERLEAFAAGLRQQIVDDPCFVAGRTEVGVVGMSDTGIELDLTTYLDVPTGSAERAARHRLMLEIVRLAERHGLVLGPGMAPPAAT